MQEQPPSWRQRTPIQVTINISPEDAESFLGLLADDDAFRERLATDPHGVLLEYGIEISGEAVPQQITLPPKADVGRFIGQAREHELLGVGEHLPHGFAILWWVLGAMPLVPRSE